MILKSVWKLPILQAQNLTIWIERTCRWAQIWRISLPVNADLYDSVETKYNPKLELKALR